MGIKDCHSSNSSSNKEKPKLTISLINARSVKNKVISLCESLREKKVTACAITETWLRSEENVIKLCPFH